jgi:HAD superfamily hydrolase (TIGR01509 family)
MPLHYLAWEKALGEHGCEFPEDVFYKWGGMPTVQIVETLGAQQGIAMDAEKVAHRKELLYYELLPQLQAVPEVLEQINLSYGKIPFAVVSGGSRESVTNSLTTLGLLDKFDTLVCSEDYTRPKPDPEPFLVAAARLNVAPVDCLVFEDTEMGVRAATAAGMASVKVLQPWEREPAG